MYLQLLLALCKSFLSCQLFLPEPREDRSGSGYHHSQLVFYKEAKARQQRINILTNWDTWPCTPYTQRKQDLNLTSYINQHKWIVDLHIKGKSVKLQKISIGENINDQGYTFEVQHQKPWFMEEINDKIYQLFNLRSCTPHKTLLREWKSTSEWETYLQETYDEGQLYKGSIVSGLSSYPEGTPTQYFIFFHFILFPYANPLRYVLSWMQPSLEPFLQQ